MVERKKAGRQCEELANQFFGCFLTDELIKRKAFLQSQVNDVEYIRDHEKRLGIKHIKKFDIPLENYRHNSSGRDDFQDELAASSHLTGSNIIPGFAFGIRGYSCSIPFGIGFGGHTSYSL